jgi:hypothetical protein
LWDAGKIIPGKQRFRTTTRVLLGGEPRFSDSDRSGW